MVDQIIRPADLPNRASPNASEKIPVDNGSNVAGATVESIVLAGRPTASQAEAEAGTDAVKAMTPLTTKQAVTSRIGVDIASKAQGDKADTALQSIGAGDNISVDNTDPINPIITAAFALTPEVAATAIGFTVRNTVNATLAASLEDGLIFTMAGLLYLVDSAATGSNSCTNDLGVNGLIPFGEVQPDHFGADPTGTVSSSAAVIAAAAYANLRDLKLVANGRFKLTGSALIFLTTDADFSGAVFDASAWTGHFRLGRKQVPVTYPAGHPVVTAFQASTDLGERSAVFSGWQNTAEVRDSFIVINTDENAYRSIGVTQKRIELNRMNNAGVASSPLMYAMTGVSIPSIDVYPMEKRRREVKGLTIDVTGNDVASDFVVITTSLLDFDVRFIQGSAPQTETNPVYVTIWNSCSIRGRIEMQWPTRTTDVSNWTYGLSLLRSYDIDLTMQAEGDGWGVTGSNLCQRVTFRDSNVNRVDFHQPVKEWLRIFSTTIGNWGLTYAATGLVHLRDVTFIRRRVPNFSTQTIIETRGDVAGIHDGDLLLENVRIVNQGDDTGSYPILRHLQNAGNAKPSGSKINYRFGRNIVIDGLTVEGPGTAVLIPAQATLGDATIAICESVSMRNLRGNIEVYSIMDGQTPSRAVSGDNLNVDIEDSTINLITFASQSNTIAVKANYRNVRGNGVDGVMLEQTAPGIYNVFGGRVRQLDFYSAGWPAFPVKMNSYGVDFVDTAHPDAMGSADQPTIDARFVDCVFRGTSVWTRVGGLLAALHERSKFFGGTTHVPTPQVTVGASPDGSSNHTLIQNLKVGQTLILESGPSGVSRTEFRLPEVGSRVIVPGVHTTTGAGLGTIIRSSSTILNCTGPVTYGRILIP